MGNEHHRFPQFRLNPQEFRLQNLPSQRIHRAERLIHQQNRRISRQRPGHPHPLSLTPRKTRRPGLGVHLRRQTHQIQQLLGAFSDPPLVPPQQPGHRRHIVPHIHMGKKTHLLNHVTHMPPQLHRRHLPRIPPVHQNPPRIRLHQPVNHLQTRRLPAARRTDQHQKLTLTHIQSEIVHRPALTEILRYTPPFQLHTDLLAPLSPGETHT